MKNRPKYKWEHIGMENDEFRSLYSVAERREVWANYVLVVFQVVKRKEKKKLKAKRKKWRESCFLKSTVTVAQKTYYINTLLNELKNIEKEATANIKKTIYKISKDKHNEEEKRKVAKINSNHVQQVSETEIFNNLAHGDSCNCC